MRPRNANSQIHVCLCASRRIEFIVWMIDLILEHKYYYFQ